MTGARHCRGIRKEQTRSPGVDSGELGRKNEGMEAEVVHTDEAPGGSRVVLSWLHWYHNQRRPGGLERDTQGPGESLRRHKAMRGRGRRGNCAHQEGAWKEPDELLCEPDAAVAVAVDDVGAPVMRSPAVIGKGPGTHCDEIRRCGEGKLRAPMKVGDTLGRDTRCPYLRVKAAKASHQTDCWRKNEGMGAEVGHTDEARTSSLRACPARVRVTADGRSWGQPRRLVVGYTGITISGGQEGLKETLLVEAPTPSSRACQAPYVAVLQGRRLHCGATLSVEPNDLQKERNRRAETSVSTISRYSLIFASGCEQDLGGAGSCPDAHRMGHRNHAGRQMKAVNHRFRDSVTGGSNLVVSAIQPICREVGASHSWGTRERPRMRLGVEQVAILWMSE
ncbi:hypothetical protein C8R46DRAFT_1042118 [Mycena filopes]|nr:hypothetical protein C8R46DRAFT_1042118 [Mycena filopes]